MQAATAPELDPEYKMALARTRQATAIHRAIGFLNTGERARCVPQPITAAVTARRLQQRMAGAVLLFVPSPAIIWFTCCLP